MKFLTLLVTILMLPVISFADDIAVTVYNNNLGVISETRTLDFTQGVHQLAFKDVPSQIDVASVRFKLLNSNNKVAIMEQNYAYDLVNPEKMYAKYIDKKIELVDKNGNLYSGTLLAYSNGAVTLQEKAGRVKIIQMGNITEINFPALPEGLITRPTLFWLYNSNQSGKYKSRISYQTSGMNWNAEYVGILSSDEHQLDLSGWASINNNSGKTYKDAKLKLIAGQIHRATPPRAIMMKYSATSAIGSPTAGLGFEEKPFFEYHMYTLPRKTTIANKENKQISLFEPARTTVQKTFIYRPDRNPKNVEVALKFKNSKSAGLGQPLPAGRVRIFKSDKDGSMILLGEDRIDHTPKNEEIKLQIGNAFDIVAKETLLNQKSISSKVDEKEFRIEITNRKDTSVTVEVEKKLYGFWEVMESNIEYKKKDATTITFQVSVNPDKKAILNYRVRYYYR
ncbi:MAG: DUF4139 domain-containing protein [FCB group bacterium]|nr:DUF4139 domain-containing protein [FCB group bacterium]